MEERIYRLNITYAIADTLVCVLGVLSFTFAAWFFDKWWIALFNLLTLALFHSHFIVVESAEKEKEE